MSPDAWTAVGTIALAVMTLVAVITTIVITNKEHGRQLEHEALTQAYAVQVAPGEYVVPGQSSHYGDDVPVGYVGVIVVNHGSFTIYDLQTQFSVGNSMLVPEQHERLKGSDEFPRGWWKPLLSSPEPSLQGVLAPWDSGVRFNSGEIHDRGLEGWYPVVRWVDRQGTRWEHKRGAVRKISKDEESHATREPPLPQRTPFSRR